MAQIRAVQLIKILIMILIFGSNDLQTNIIELKGFIWHSSLYSRDIF